MPKRTPKPHPSVLVSSLVTEIKRTASFDPCAHYVVGALSALLEIVIHRCPDARQCIERHEAHLKTLPNGHP